MKNANVSAQNSLHVKTGVRAGVASGATKPTQTGTGGGPTTAPGR